MLIEFSSLFVYSSFCFLSFNVLCADSFRYTCVYVSVCLSFTRHFWQLCQLFQMPDLFRNARVPYIQTSTHFCLFIDVFLIGSSCEKFKLSCIFRGDEPGGAGGGGKDGLAFNAIWLLRCNYLCLSS